MLGASIINKKLDKTVDLADNDREVCDDSANRYGTKLTNGSSIKENTDSSIQINHCIGSSKTNYNTNGRCESAKRKLLAESELNELLPTTPNSTILTTIAKNKGTADDTEPDTLTITNSSRQQEFWDQDYSFPRLIHPTHLEPFVLQPSLFHMNNVPPTIYFNTKLNDESRPPVGLPKRLQPMFKWKISSITPNTIRSCISFMKFEIIRSSNTEDTSYLGSWCKHMPTADFTSLEEWRKVNHYPGSFHMGRKDKLWTRLKLAREKFESFHPTTFVLPKDYKELEDYWQNSPNKLFIMKPPASARGNGIKVINNISQIPSTAYQTPFADCPTKKSTIIVQQYISNPCLLENGFKFDLRVYVLLTSVDPLRVYVYEDGLVRFASSKYTCQDDGIIDQYMHLTNYFVNKNNQKYQPNNDCESLHGCKWSLKRFWRYLKENHTDVDTDKLWDKIIDIIIKTIISCESPMNRLSHQFCKNDYTSYELFGFDIILDENFKPWILEVNITPSLKSESKLDTSVKYRVIKDMFNLVGYHLPPSSAVVAGNKSVSSTDQKLFFNPRLYKENLTKRDRIKQIKYQKLFKHGSGTEGNDLIGEVGDSSLSYRSTTTNGDHLAPNCPATSHASVIAECSENVAYGVSSGEDDLSQGSRSNEQSSRDRLISKESILSDLSQSDVRMLILAEDELSRCGQFKRVFPSADSSKYLKYFDRPRYYNILLDAWEQKYGDNRIDGVRRLSNLAKFLD